MILCKNNMNLKSLKKTSYLFLFIVSLLINYSCESSKKDEHFLQNMEKAIVLAETQPDSLHIIVAQYERKKTNDYQKQYLNFLNFKKNKKSNKIDSLNTLLYSDFEEIEEGDLRSQIIKEILNRLASQNPEVFEQTTTLDSLIQSYEKENWFSPRLHGEMYVHVIDLLYNRTNKITGEIQTNIPEYLEKLKTIAEESEDDILSFEYVERLWLFHQQKYQRDPTYNPYDLIPISYQLVERANAIGKEKYHLIAYKKTAASYYHNKIYDESVKWKYKELQILEKEKDYEKIGILYNNLGVIYEEYNKHQEAIDNLYKSLQAYEKLSNNKEFIVRSQYNLMLSFNGLGELDSSYAYSKKMQEMTGHVKSTAVKEMYSFLSALNIADIHSKRGNFAQAESQFDSLHPAIQKVAVLKFVKSNFLLHYAQHKLRIKDYKKAKNLIEENIDLFKMPFQLPAYQVLIDANKGIGDFKKAYHYKEELTLLNEKYLNEKNIAKIESEKLNYSHQKQIDAQESIHQLALKNKTIQVYVSLLIGIIFLFTLIYYWKTNENRKKIIHLSESKNTIISSKNTELIKLNDKLNRFAETLAHDIKMPIANVHQYISYLSDKYLKKIDPEDKEIFTMLHQSTLNLCVMINTILNYSSKTKEFQRNDKISLNSIVSLVQNNLKAQIKTSHTRIQVPDHLPLIKANQILIEQLFLNLLSNAIKYKKKNEDLIIEVNAKKHSNDFTLISVKDNGIGIPEEILESIFTLYNTYNNEIEVESKGIGLAVSKKIVEEFGGEIWVESEVGKGSVFYFTIPTWMEEPILLENDTNKKAI